MSFLRVGGFVLSHAGMMLVVYTLMDMSASIAGQTIILVAGNLFVMGLEGLIVGIQVLRLEFYEMFSRYFEGNGIPFETFE
jgi:V/A-type H+-transporting ATPase subunit I